MENLVITLTVAHCSLLLVLLGVVLLLGALDAVTEEASSRVVLLEEGIGVGLGLLNGDLAGGLLSLAGKLAVDVDVLDGSLLLSLAGLTSGNLLVVDGEEDELGDVGLEALNVGVQGLLGDVLAASINADTDGGGVAGLEASSGELLSGETSTEALLHVVANGGASNNGAELTEGAGEDLLGLLETKATTALLLLGLSKVDLKVTLLGRAGVVVLALVHVGDSVVTLRHDYGPLTWISKTLRGKKLMRNTST